MAVAYATLLNDVQSEIHTILSTDATVIGFTTKIVDGLPYTDMQRGRGFPYIKIPIGTLAESQKTMGKIMVIISVPITVYTRKASTLRQLSDAIRNALKTNQNVTEGLALHNFFPTATSPNEFLLPDKKPLYEYSILVQYKWVGA